MCVVSMIGDHFGEHWDDWKKYIPNVQPLHQLNIPMNPLPSPSREEFDQLKKEVEIMKALLKKAKIYDEENNEPNCEIEEKMKFLREIAKFVGVDLDEVFKPKTNG